MNRRSFIQTLLGGLSAIPLLGLPGRPARKLLPAPSEPANHAADTWYHVCTFRDWHKPPKYYVNGKRWYKDFKNFVESRLRDLRDRQQLKYAAVWDKQSWPESSEGWAVTARKRFDKLTDYGQKMIDKSKVFLGSRPANQDSEDFVMEMVFSYPPKKVKL